MRLDNAKILISDDSILARKQLKDFISKYGTPTFSRHPTDRMQLISIKGKA